MAIILKANKVNLFASSVLFVVWYHSLNFLGTPCILETTNMGDDYFSGGDKNVKVAVV
jgi:hypothetical protein